MIHTYTIETKENGTGYLIRKGSTCWDVGTIDAAAHRIAMMATDDLQREQVKLDTIKGLTQ